VLVLALSPAALPRAAAAGAGGQDPQFVAAGPKGAGPAEQEPLKVKFKPLFDVRTRYKPKKTVKLRFQAREAVSGAPIHKEKIVFSLRHAEDKSIETVTPKVVKPGVFELAFTPPGPGLYIVQAMVRGARLGEIPPVRLGVVGVSDGLVEVPASEDAEFERKARAHGSGPTKR